MAQASRPVRRRRPATYDGPVTRGRISFSRARRFVYGARLMKLTSLSPVLLAFALAACGGDDDGVTPTVDAPGSIDAAVDAPVTCSVSTRNFGDKGALTPSICVQDPGQDAADPMDDVIFMRAPLEAGSPFDEIEIQLWAGFGALTNGFANGTYPITGDETQFATCGVCVFLNTNRVDDQTYEDDYFATGGTVTLTSVQGNLTGTVSNLTFEHVTVAQGESTPVGDGCTTGVTAASFTAPITTPPPAKPRPVTGSTRAKTRHLAH